MTTPIEEKWRKVIEEWKASGLSALRYAREHQVSKDSLYKWAKYFGHSFTQRTAVSQASALSFIEVGSIAAQEEPMIALEVALPLGTTVRASMSWLQVLELVKVLRC
mgnify:CR=1 FL=1